MAPSSLFFFLVTLLHLFGWKTVVAQVTAENPLIWQTLVSPYSSNNYDYVSESTYKYYSQDFQTVHAYNDNYGHNQRLLINAGDGCHNLTFATIASYNNGLSAFIKRQPVMGLVTRGGGCTWSTKLNTMKSLVMENANLDMTGVLIYDDNNNATTGDASIIRVLPSQLGPTHWNTSMAPQRNVSSMLDNDLSNNAGTLFMAVYYIPYAFAQEMLGKMNNTNSHYVMLAPYFFDGMMDDNPSNSNTNGNNSDSTDDNGVGTDNIFGAGNRGYIAYLVAAGAAIIMAIILFRWCRHPRFGLGRYRRNNVHDPEEQLPYFSSRRAYQPQIELDPVSCIPIEKLDVMCAAQPASEVLDQMKNTVCAICLDDFKPTSIIRLLPCHHGFCVACIDFWLTKKSSVCPICKYDCAPPQVEEEEEEEDDLGKMHPTTNTLSPSLPPSSSSSTSTTPAPPPPPATATTQAQVPDLTERDLGTTSSSSPPPYIQSSLSPETSTRTTPPPSS
ncbi:hypothetical protein BCR42DRAFT_356919 [Absidia repens]|uniref:RING-type domain-containing protein n=1 Tax=Absidia repens TaxID=90262 RepID=A0A1X2I831_9FUNG|nr:hypothetical protein BCR42DRAFT_356919 [Absidia repens]